MGRGFCAAAAIATFVAAPALAWGVEPVRRLAPERVYVVVYDSDGLAERDRRDLEDAVARGVRGDGSVTAVVPERSSGVEAVQQELERGDQALAAARDKVRDLDLDAAIQALERAATVYRDNLPDLMLRDGNADALVAVYRELAVAQFLNGDEDAAGRALAQVFVFKPKMDYDQRLPPQMRELVVSAGLLFEEMGRGSLTVTVTGGDAVIYVNGEERGEAPLTVADLPAGPNVVNAVVAGAPTVTVEADVEGGATAEVQLEVLPPPVAIPPELDAVRGDVGASEASARMRALKGSLGVEALVLVRRAARGQLEAYVYDLRTGRLAGKATGADAVELGGAAFGGSDWGIIETRPTGPGTWEVWNPDHKYFWHAVGAAAGVVTAVTIGVIAARSSGLSNGERVVVFGLGTKF